MTRSQGNLIVGCALSLGGALLGALIWAIVAVATGFEIGWIAWGVGLLAGLGMAMGYRPAEGGVPAVLAAIMALVGVAAAKVFILAWYVVPALATAGAEAAVVDARMIAQFRMVDETLKLRGIDPEKASEEEVDAVFEEVSKRVEAMSDDEIDRYVAAQTPDAPDVVDADLSPEVSFMSVAGGAFAAMFSPMDIVFILLALVTAAKVGGGGSSD